MKKFAFKKGIEYARQLDKDDPIKDIREKFYIPEPHTIYLDGNSLGRLPLKTREKLQHITDFQWGNRMIRSWNEGWYTCAEEVSTRISKIIGAQKDEVITGDSTSVNLYKLAYAAAKFMKGRTKIVSDDLNFPTDIYVLQGVTEQMGADYKLELAASTDGQTVDIETLEQIIDEDTALVVLSHVTFKSAFMYNMAKVTALAHSKGALILWDLSHAAGAVPVELNISNADLAIGCTYKYLNGGPGSPAYLYVRKDLQEHLNPPIQGWFGDADPFSFELRYRPANGVRKFLVGTPPVLSLEAITPGLDITIEAGIDAIREKSITQTEYLIYLFENLLKPLGFSLGSPLDPSKRGSHISLRHTEAYRICKALIASTDSEYVVIPDFREPDNIRIGITPLYTTFTEIFLAVDKIRKIFVDKTFEAYSKDKESVT